MGQVIVRFHGVCSHYIDVVPHVPQRVVLPDASPLRFGYIEWPSQPTTLYFLMPHFPILRMPDGGHERFSIPHVIDRGNIVDGVHLQIANAVGPMNGRETVSAAVPSLPSYVAKFEYSQDVVIGQRAAVYFDLFAAQKQEVVTEIDEAAQVVATIETDGPPILRATPFAGGPSYDFPLMDDPAPPVLWVANQGMDCTSTENSYDFLLHFLTAKGGIPRVFAMPPEGLRFAESPTPDTFNTAVDLLKKLEYPQHFAPPCFQLQELPERPELGLVLLTSAACANSTYP